MFWGRAYHRLRRGRLRRDQRPKEKRGDGVLYQQPALRASGCEHPGCRSGVFRGGFELSSRMLGATGSGGLWGGCGRKEVHRYPHQAQGIEVQVLRTRPRAGLTWRSAPPAAFWSFERGSMPCSSRARHGWSLLCNPLLHCCRIRLLLYSFLRVGKSGPSSCHPVPLVTKSFTHGAFTPDGGFDRTMPGDRSCEQRYPR